MSVTNTIQRFLFDDLDIRGAVVRLDAVWQKLIKGRNYPAPVIELLGEMTATTLLLADNLKQPGRLTVQLRGEGKVSLLVIDCNESLNLRCMAQHDEHLGTGKPVDLLGDGQLQLSLENEATRKPYQSVVPLVGESIGAIFEHYLAQSEQLASRFFLAASASGIAGLFLQKMPDADQRDADGWTRIEALASTVSRDELTGLSAEDLLLRLFHEETVRVFAAREVAANSSKDWEKVSHMLLTLGREEVYAALQQNNAIIIRDDLSNHEYRFDRADIDKLFSQMPEVPRSVH